MIKIPPMTKFARKALYTGSGQVLYLYYNTAAQLLGDGLFDLSASELGGGSFDKQTNSHQTSNFDL